MLLRHRPEMVITSVGSPAPVIGPLHDAGSLVLADVASIRHAERAVAPAPMAWCCSRPGPAGRPAGSIRSPSCARCGNFRRADGAGGRGRRRPRAPRRRGARLRSRLYGHEIHRHAGEHGGYRYKEMLVASSADDILLTRPSRDCRPTC